MTISIMEFWYYCKNWKSKPLSQCYIFGEAKLDGVYMMPDRVSFRYDTQRSFHVFIEVLILEWKYGKNIGHRKHEPADLLNLSTCLVRYWNGLVPPFNEVVERSAKSIQNKNLATV